MKDKNSLRRFLFLCVIIIPALTLQFCLKKQTVETAKPEQKNLTESYRKTGWIEEEKYRTGVYVITREECSTSVKNDIDEKIRLEAFKHLQKELNPSFSRNASVQIKSLIDNYGKVTPAGTSCIESNVYFFDLEKKGLKSDFTNIKNLK